MTGIKTFWAVFCMIMISISSVSAKYIRQTELTGVVNARNFYFVSDLLDGGVHQVMVKEDTMASVTLTLMNYMDEERYSEVDIDYVVEAEDTDKDEKTEKREYERLLEIRDNYPKYVLRTDEFAGGNYQGIKSMHIADFLLSTEY